MCAAAVTACSRAVDGREGAPAKPAALSCARPHATAIVACLRTSLSRYWTATLHHPLDMRTVYAPRPAQVPADCRNGLDLDTAFSCPVDDTVYLTAGFVRRTLDTGPRGDGWIRLATTMSHEMGHIVQFDEHAPLLTKRGATQADSRTIEQQADRLSGVWASGVGLRPAVFVAANAVVLGIVDNPHERLTHGGPAVRLLATRRGLAGRTPQACGLVLTR